MPLVLNPPASEATLFDVYFGRALAVSFRYVLDQTEEGIDPHDSERMVVKRAAEVAALALRERLRYVVDLDIG